MLILSNVEFRGFQNSDKNERRRKRKNGIEEGGGEGRGKKGVGEISNHDE